MKLKNRKSYMTMLPEGRPPRERKAGIAQLVYLLALFGIFGYLAKASFDRWQYFAGKGRVEAEKTLITSRFGGRITMLSIQEGKELKAGDPIAQIEPNRKCEQKANPNIPALNITPNEDKLNLKREKLQDDIALKKARLKVLSTYLEELNRETDKTIVISEAAKNHEPEEELSSELMLRRALEVGARRTTKRAGNTGQARIASQNRQLNREKMKVKTNIELLKTEIVLKRKQLRRRPRPVSKRVSKRAPKTVLPSSCFPEIILAPSSGRVQAVKLGENEFAQRGKPIATLVEHRAPVRIEALFERELMAHLTPGSLLDITFPDDLRSQGRIASLSSPNYAISTQNRTLSMEGDRYIRARITPINEEEGRRWIKYDRMEVRLRGSK